MDIRDVSEELRSLAMECMEMGSMERPEVTWLKERYRDFMRRENITGRETADRCIYRRMYGGQQAGSPNHLSEKKTDILKIRYWRTGWHLPVSHEQCIAFGRALGLGRDEMKYLLQAYYDSCDRIYQEEPVDLQADYWTRRKAMKRFTDRYLQGIPGEKLAQMRITDNSLERSMRHLYYTDALEYVFCGMAEQKEYLKRHIISVNYDSEFGRSMKLLGIIPRKTMIRHLLIFGMPQISREWMNEQLRLFGYLELQEQHTLRGGERMDWLLIRLLRRYEEFRPGRTAEECRGWMRNQCRILDMLFEKVGRKHLRFMYFKSLKEF